MPVHVFDPPKGRVVELTIDSRALADNRLGDPGRRTVAVYLPPAYESGADDYPLFVDLAGFTGSGLKRLSWVAFGENVPQRVDRLVREGKMGPVVVAFPDCFTSLGGTQYVNSSVMGRCEDFLLDELLPFLERELRIRKGPRHRAVYGKSSGGYGALVQALKHGEQWAAVAAHSPDLDFDIAYRRDFPATLETLAHHGGVDGFLGYVRDCRKLRGNDFHVLMILAMAASYDPAPDLPHGIRLPVDPATCALDADAWARWLEHDPLRLVDRAECRARLGGLKGLFIDCGHRDQYYLYYGARALSRKLTEHRIRHRYEEFDDDHSSVDYRMDESLPFLFDSVSVPAQNGA